MGVYMHVFMYLHACGPRCTGGHAHVCACLWMIDVGTEARSLTETGVLFF